MRNRTWLVITLSVLTALDAGAQTQAAPPPAAPAPAKADSLTRYPGVDSAKVAAIRHLLDVMGVRASMSTAMQGMVDIYKRQMPSVPPEFWTQFMAEANGDEIIDLVIPIYARHYSMAELQALAAFFDSPTGRKFVAEQPSMTRESMAAGAEWGRVVGARIMKKLTDAGYKPPTG